MIIVLVWDFGLAANVIHASDVDTQVARPNGARIAWQTKRYPSDLTDEEGERIAPLMPKPGRRGGPREIEFGEVINAVRYLVGSGCAWQMPPGAFRPLADGLRLVPRVGKDSNGLIGRENFNMCGKNWITVYFLILLGYNLVSA